MVWAVCMGNDRHKKEGIGEQHDRASISMVLCWSLYSV